MDLNFLEGDLFGKTIAIIVFLFVIIVLFSIINKKNKINKIKNTKPKQKFEYLDVFIYCKNEKEIDISSNGAYNYYSKPILHYVIKDINNSKLYVVSQNNIVINARLFSFNPLNKTINLIKGNNFKKNSLNFHDKGCFWINKTYDNCFSREKNDVILYNNKLNYVGNISQVHDITNTKIIYNLNPNYDISLLDNATFISAVIEFDLNK